MALTDPDVLVVGAGVAGCVTARRLTDAGLRVLVLEAGSTGPPPSAIAGSDVLAALDEPGWTWPTDDRVRYVRGRGAGGGSAVNGMVMMAGDSVDHRGGANTAAAGYDLVSEIVRVADELALGPQPHGPLTMAFRRAARAAGAAAGPSSASLDQTGLLTAALAFGDGRRRSVDQRYLVDVDVIGDVEVTELTGRGSTVDGVRATVGSGTQSFAARHVVLSAGALVSPRILLAAGLGNPQVGRGLKDHPAVALTVGLRQVPLDGRLPITTVLRWSSGLEANDLLTMPVESVDRAHGVVLTSATRVLSEGRVELDRFEFSSLDHPTDRHRLRRAVRGTADLLSHPAIGDVVDAVYLDDVGTPLDRLPVEDDELDEWLLAALGGIYHAACSCRFGSAVGNGGRVAEASGVSVIDASVLPDLPRANPQLAVMAMASWLAEDLARML